MTRRAWLVLAVFSWVGLASMFAADSTVERVAPPDLPDLQARGRVAMREWVALRRAADDSPRADEVKDLDAAMELAGFVFNEAGGEVIDEVLAETEEVMARAQANVTAAREKARQAANVGDAYERLAGRPADARRLYLQALRLDRDDAVAKEGLARLDRAERIDEHKEIEVERLKELEAYWAQQPRSRPPLRTPFEDVNAP